MLDAKAYFLSCLTSDQALMDRLGGPAQIVYNFPKTFFPLPRLSYRELSQSQVSAADNAPESYRVEFQVDIWDNAATGPATALSLDVARALEENLWTLNGFSDVADPDQRVSHHSARFVRVLRADDLD